MRQGWEAAKNITATVRGFPMHDYKHKDLGLVVDLGGVKAVAKPLGIPLSGFPAQVVARGYHVMALRTFSARFRTVAGWMLNSVVGDDFVRTGFQAQKPASLKDFEHTEQYLTTGQISERLVAAGIVASTGGAGTGTAA
jgi:NADH dehydrogenase